MNLKKLLSIFIILSAVFFVGCWSNHEINTLAIAVCIGIDKSEDGYLISEQVINPKAIASKKSTNESPSIIYTEKGKDLDETIRKFSQQTSRKIYSSHLRMIVFGEEFARDGINSVLDYFLRNNQYRTDFYFVVARNSTANEILNILTPLESIPGIEMYNSLKMSSEEWAPTKSVRIVELINCIIADGKNAVLTGIEIAKGKISPVNTDTLRQSSNIKKLVYTGIGALKKDKLIGWMDKDESKGYNYITGNIKRSIGYINYGKNVTVTLEITKADSVIKASLVNGKPSIDVKIKVKENIEAVKGDFDVSKDENRKILNELAEEKIKLVCYKTVNKVQKEFKSDILGFGEIVHKKYPKLWKKIKNNWNNEFVDIPVKITAEVETIQLGQITRPVFIKENS